tara:strand:+ start:461 stop:1060 length:600 start_codon:yes stop_codon:yes gene_type:complete
MKNFKKFVSAIFTGLSLLSSPIFANEYSTKGSYFTGSIGGSAIGDIDVSGINSDIEFETGLGLDIGYGYDFGTTRLEGTWVRGQSDKTSWLGYTVKADTTIDSIMGSLYYDFREDKQWVPFIGASLGSTSVDFDGASDSGFSWGISYGLSYKTSDTVEVFFKGQTTVIPELTFATVNNSTVIITNGNYSNATIGLRVRF